MKILWLDFESFYDNDYSLSKMTAAEYILDPRFEALGCAFIQPQGEAVWVDGPDLPAFLDGIDWADTFAVSHNATFDMAVLAWRYGHVPKRIGCTLSMSRAWTEHQIGRSKLEFVAPYHDLPPKGDTIFKMKGVRYAALRADPVFYDEFVEYGRHDAWLCREVFKKLLADGFPPGQLELIDMVVRMTVEPVLRFDGDLLTKHLDTVRADKAELLHRVGLDNGAPLMSNDKFADLLKVEGVEPPTKVSAQTRQVTWAFSKQDWAFTELGQHDNPHVQALVAARLGWKSTLEESRTETFLAISHLSWPSGLECAAPMPLRFYGAHTGRLSGDWGLNTQNLGRNSTLRYALKAPPGKVIVSVDAEQIEARILAYLADQDDLVEQFRNRDDVYARFAERIFGYAVSKEETPRERFVGKVAVLSLGYGSSARTFANMCRVQSDGQVVLSDDEARRVVSVYRNTNDQIVALWNRLDRLIPLMTKNANGRIGPVVIRNEVATLPNGMRLVYRDLHQDDKYGRVSWFYRYGVKTKVLYGSKMLENVTQALAFIVVMQAAQRVRIRTKGLLRPCHQVHDELLFCVDARIADKVAYLVKEEMSREPDWLPGVPLAAAHGIGESYGDC